MVLNFTKTSALWVAEFIASSDFNLHIEGVKVRDLEVYQRGVGDGKYFIVTDAKENLSYASEVYDMDFAALVYPKHIKVVCRTEPSLAEITTDGEVTEIKAQTKEIEVTSNGTTVVEPDAGFAYLSNVKVKTNVPTSGEGGGSASSWRYFDISKLDNSMKPMVLPFIVKTNDRITVSGAVDWTAVDAFGVDDSPKLYVEGAIVTWSQMMAKEGLTPEVMAQVGIVEITEAEFYNLNVPA